MALDVVTTSLGRVSGSSGDDAAGDGITVFRGIPYAAPPVGDLRWRAPVAAEPWTGTRACVALAPGALQQFHNDWFLREGYVPGYRLQTPPMSEDCLYLNVTTGARSAGEKRPVYVWFHGGGLTNGFPSEAPTDPRTLAGKGLVVVSVGQRVNTFGYLALPQLREEQGGSGNYGFRDQLAAMDWIVANIGAFGGDPANITVGGQSGGAQKAASLVATPHGAGRIRRVISQSGLKWMQPLADQEWAEAHGRRLLEALGLPVDAAPADLRQVDASTFLRPLPRDLLPDYMVTDELLPYANLREGIDEHAGGVDFLNGMCLGETDVFAASAANPEYTPPAGRRIDSAADLHAHLRSLLGDLYEEFDVPALVDVDDASAGETARVLASSGLAGSERTNISRNLMLNRMFGGYLAQHGSTGRVFNYLWSYRIPPSPSDAGTPRDPALGLTWHGADTWYMFGTTAVPNVSPGRPWADHDHRLADTMSSYVANFVATGDPNAPGLPVWPAGADHGYLEVGRQLTGHSGCDTALDRLTGAFVAREYALDVRAMAKESR